MYVCLIINMVFIPFRGIFDPFGDVQCSDPSDLSSCRGSRDSPLFFSTIDYAIDGAFVLDVCTVGLEPAIPRSAD